MIEGHRLFGTKAMNIEQKERFSDALARLAGDVETFSVLASITVEDAPALFDQLDKSLGEKDWDGYAKSAHAIKGLFSTFETGEPVSNLQSLIDAARSGDGPSVVAAHTEVKQKLCCLLDEINRLKG